jgi:hypothetical protein
MSDTPAPIFPVRRCSVCHKQAQNILILEGKERCPGCLLDRLPHCPRGKKRRSLLRALDEIEWLQGYFDFGGSLNVRRANSLHRGNVH